MAIPLPRRYMQIAVRLTPNSLSQRLITPTSVTILTVVCWHQIINIELKFCAFIRSITAANIPFLDPLWTSKERQDAIANFKLNTPKKGVRLYMQRLDQFSNSPTGQAFFLGDVDLFNTSPFYNEETYVFDNLALQPGWALFAQVVDRGSGLLGSSDYIDIVGSALEYGEVLQDAEDRVIPTITRAI